MSERLYPLEKVVADWGLTDDMVDPVRWLTKQISTGRVRARKIGRSWRMTQTDIEAALEVFASRSFASPPAVSDDRPRGGMSAASLRRRLSA